MTEEIQVLPVSIEGTMPSADGQYVLVKTKAGDQETVLAVDLDQAFALVSGVASGATKCREQQGVEHSTEYTMNVQEWAFWGGQDGALVVSFQVLGGTKMSFQVDASQIPLMRGGLQAMEAAASGSPAPDTSQL